MVDFVGYSSNPGNIKRNQITSKSNKIEPKFRSEQERDLMKSKETPLSQVIIGLILGGT
jgi:hypothetical protein